MGFKQIFWIVFTPLLLCGFRVIPFGNQWNVSNSSTASAKLFVDYSTLTQTLTNNLPSGDPLAGSGATLTVAQLMASIFNDYNNIQGAFLTLADTSDSDYAANSTNRIIHIASSTSVSGLTSGGEAQPTLTNGQITDCNIRLTSHVFENAKTFVAGVTHELGHCLGLHHAMDTVNSIMSYYVSADQVRLMIDDKMGITYLYPVYPSKAQEEASLGLACAKK